MKYCYSVFLEGLLTLVGGKNRLLVVMKWIWCLFMCVFLCMYVYYILY